MKQGLRAVAMSAIAVLVGCGGTGKLSKPVPDTTPHVIAEATDYRVTASIESVIVRDGPGSWAKNAFWDEYRIRVTVADGWAVEISRVVVVDSLGEHHRPGISLQELADGTQRTAERYQDSNLRMTPGLGGALEAGVLVGGTSAAVGLATLGSTGAAATAATAGLVVAPVLIGAGLIGMAEVLPVQFEIDRRNTSLPLELVGGSVTTLDLFFPVAPSPQQVNIRYSDPAGVHVLSIDTSTALAGLHLLPKAAATQKSEQP